MFVYILQGKMGNQKENHSTKVTKIPKTKRQKYGMNETTIFKMYFKGQSNNTPKLKKGQRSFDILLKTPFKPPKKSGPGNTDLDLLMKPFKINP